MTIWIIRHAQSTANTGIAFEKSKDVKLTEHGMKQSQALADWFSWDHIDEIYTSSFVRAQETAKPLAEKYSITPKILPIEEFSYISEDKIVGMDFNGIIKEAGVYWEKNDPEYKHGPLSENFIGLCNRILAFEEKLVELNRSGKNIVIFSHNRFLVTWTIYKKNAIMPKTPKELKESDIDVDNISVGIYPSYDFTNVVGDIISFSLVSR